MDPHWYPRLLIRTRLLLLHLDLVKVFQGMVRYPHRMDPSDYDSPPQDQDSNNATTEGPSQLYGKKDTMVPTHSTCKVRETSSFGPPVDKNCGILPQATTVGRYSSSMIVAKSRSCRPVAWCCGSMESHSPSPSHHMTTSSTPSVLPSTIRGIQKHGRSEVNRFDKTPHSESTLSVMPMCTPIMSMRWSMVVWSWQS